MTQSIKDFYGVLGVEKDASADEIKKAFRAKARECHPDVCESDDGEERFKAVNEAYEVLSDPRKREVYDRFGTADPRAAGMGGFDGVPFEDIFGMGMEDVFGMFFGGGMGRGSRGPAPREGRDLAARMTVTLEEAATGVEKELEIGRDAPCDACDATGGSDGTVTKCPDCGGSGRRTVTRQTMLGAMRSVTPCAKCSETGEVVENACGECGGSGRRARRERVSVTVPAGIQDGMAVRVGGFGEAGVRGADGGDLIVTVRVAPHDRLFREGDDLHAQVRVPFATAAIGGKVRFAGLMFEEEVEVPSGTQYGDVLRIKGRGMPRVRGNAGDLYVHVAVDVPKRLKREERELVERLGRLRGDGEKPALVDRISDWLGRR